MLKNINLKPALTLVCILAVALQIQVTVFSAVDYDGLRLNLADIALPFIGLYIAITLLLKKSKWPQWRKPKLVYISLTTLTIVMSIALIQGYFSNGFFSSWAFINKYLGFFILMSYTLLGGWLATNINHDNLKLYFLQVFCGFSIITVGLSLLTLIIEALTNIPLWIGNYHWDGFMANRNAYMILAIFTLITVNTHHYSSSKLLPNWVFSLLWFLMPFFVIFNASRTFWIIGGIITLIILLIRPLDFIKKVLPFLLLGGLLCASLTAMLDSRKYHGFAQFNTMKHLILEKEARHRGDQARIIVAQDGLALYSQSNPLIGSGLGTFKEFQIEKRGEFITIIDFTALWFLVETGAIGLIAFGSFFFLCLWVFFKQGKENNIDSPFYWSLFFFLIAFAAASFLHELTYTRFLWFLLGLGLIKSYPR